MWKLLMIEFERKTHICLDNWFFTTQYLPTQWVGCCFWPESIHQLFIQNYQDHEICTIFMVVKDTEETALTTLISNKMFLYAMLDAHYYN